jgi:DNA-binding NtrC family response regulator
MACGSTKGTAASGRIMTTITSASLLFITDQPNLPSFLKETAIQKSYHVHRCRKEDNVFVLLKEKNVRLVLLETGGEESWERKLLALIKAFDPLIETIILGPPESTEATIDWLNLGASDYLVEPVAPGVIKEVLDRLQEKRNLRRETYLLEKELERKYVFHGIVGKSPFMLDVFSTIETIARYFSTVLITGVTGTGKDLVARALHECGGAKDKKLVICDCVALPENLFESELFGYKKGAFTGADRDKKGLLEEAEGGIIFFDEIGEIPLSIQAKMLRILETRQYRPVGANTTKQADIRIIAATNRDLRDQVQKGLFREDLFYRLNKVTIHLLPLKDRAEDIPLLVRHMLDFFTTKTQKTIRGISRNVQKLFLSYDWPGNVRELKNVIERAVIFTKKDFIDIPDLPAFYREQTAAHTRIPFWETVNVSTLDNLESEYLAYLLKANHFNVKRTAEILKISRTALYDKIKKFKIVLAREGRAQRD